MVDGERQAAETKSGISKEQKIGFVLLFAFALMTVGLGVLQLRNNIYGPFALNNTIPSSIKDSVNSTEALQLRDTDKDELSDFDELYVYGTSPYLMDSDSDGEGDKQEIEKGADPLCAEGQQCTGIIASGEAEVVNDVSSSLKVLGVEPSANFGPEPVDLNQALQDPAQVRSLLQGAGVGQEVLKAISDQELMSMVSEIMSASSTSALDKLKNVKTDSTNSVATTTKKSQ